MIIGYTGSRQGMTDIQMVNLHKVICHYMPNITEGRHGDCVGGDAEFHLELQESHILPVIHPPSDPKYRAWCKGGVVLPEQPYLIRNRHIVENCDLLVAAPAEMENPGHGGTWWTVEYAKIYPRNIVILYPDGTWADANYEIEGSGENVP